MVMAMGTRKERRRRRRKKHKLSERNLNPNIPAKFGYGIILLGIGSLITRVVRDHDLAGNKGLLS